MTEEEIVSYLKENKTKGVAFVFMPKEVKEWACDNSRFIIYYNKFGWCDYSNNLEIYRPTDVIALPQNYEPKIEQQSGWVEFDIYDGGIFTGEFGTGEEAFTEDFHWWNWQEFLDQASNNDMGFTAFGGWQYEGFLSWHMQPMLRGKGNKKELRNYEDNHEESTPTIPVKIRFWREVK